MSSRSGVSCHFYGVTISIFLGSLAPEYVHCHLSPTAGSRFIAKQGPSSFISHVQPGSAGQYQSQFVYSRFGETRRENVTILPYWTRFVRTGQVSRPQGSPRKGSGQNGAGVTIMLLPHSECLVRTLVELRSQGYPASSVWTERQRRDCRRSTSLARLDGTVPEPPSQYGPAGTVPAEQFRSHRRNVTPLGSSRRKRSRGHCRSTAPLELFQDSARATVTVSPH